MTIKLGHELHTHNNVLIDINVYDYGCLKCFPNYNTKIMLELEFVQLLFEGSWRQSRAGEAPAWHADNPSHPQHLMGNPRPQEGSLSTEPRVSPYPSQLWAPKTHTNKNVILGASRRPRGPTGVEKGELSNTFPNSDPKLGPDAKPGHGHLPIGHREAWEGVASTQQGATVSLRESRDARAPSGVIA